MKITAYLIVSSTGRLRLTKGRPALNSDELSMHLTLTVPALFFERTVPQVSITIPESAVLSPGPELAVTVTARAAAEALGLDADEVEDGLTRLVKAKGEVDADDV